MIVVKDNGIGIERDKLCTIFERYNQVQTTLTKKCEGSGIGLSITKSLVEMHHGQINVTSNPGKGTAVVVKIPDILCTDSEAAAAAIVSSDQDSSDQNIILKMNVEFSDIYL